MIEEKEILKQLEKLPAEMRLEVLHYVEFLQTKLEKQLRKPRRAGSAEGKYTLAPDFDAPLEDFKEYM